MPRALEPVAQPRLAAAAVMVLMAASAPAAAESPREGVAVGPLSLTRKLVPAERIEAQATEVYGQRLKQAAQYRVLASSGDLQLERLRRIADKLIPHAARFNERAKEWTWTVNLIKTPTVNALCMPGGKILVFSGFLERFNPTDNELAIVLGHEMAHALREHARVHIAKRQLTGLGAQALSVLLGIGAAGQVTMTTGSDLLNLRYSRHDEEEADLIGMELAARAGFDPRAGPGLWAKQVAAGPGKPEWLSTHPASATRATVMRRQMARVLPLYARAIGTEVSKLPPVAP